MGKLNFDITANDGQFKTTMSNVIAAINGVDSACRKSGMSIDDFIAKVQKAATASATVLLAKDFVQKVVTVRGQFQQLEIAFRTMLGSEEKASALMSQLVETAAKTPFDMEGVTNGAKQLLAYGVEAGKVNETLTMFGDIAAVLSLPLGDLVYLYGTTMTQGRMFTMDLRQFMGRGIPIAEELAKQFGVTKDEVGELVTAGKVGAEEFQKAIWSMTDAGSKFGGLMEAQSSSITGQISNIGDSVEQMVNRIGKASEPLINAVLSGVSSAVENYEQIGKAIAEAIAVYGTYKAVLISCTALQRAYTVALRVSAVAQRNVSIANVALGTSLKVLKAQWAALNATMLANPFVVIAAAAAGLGFAIYKLATYQTEAQKQQERLNEALEEGEKKAIDERIALAGMFADLSRAKEGTQEYADAKQAIIDKYSSYGVVLNDETLSVSNLTKTYNELTEAINGSYEAQAKKEFLDSEQTAYNDVRKDNLAKIKTRLVELAQKGKLSYKDALAAYAEISEKVLNGSIKTLSSYDFNRYNYGTQRWEKWKQGDERNPFSDTTMEAIYQSEYKGAGLVTPITKAINGIREKKVLLDNVTAQLEDEEGLWPPKPRNLDRTAGNGGKPQTVYGAEYEKARKEWAEAKAGLEAIEKDRDKFTLEQYKNARKRLSDAEDSFQALGGDTKGRDSKSADKRKDAEEKYQTEVLSMTKDFGQEKRVLEYEARKQDIMAAKSGYEQKLALLELENDKELDDIRAAAKKRTEEIDKASEERYKAVHGSAEGWKRTEQDTALVSELERQTEERIRLQDEAYSRKRKQLEKERSEQELQYENSYLEQYGSYKEKEAAITGKFETAKAEAIKNGAKEESYQIKLIEKERDNALYELRKDYSAAYELIFAAADRLTDTQLAKAIRLTQEEIEKAKDSGDIEALKDLYAQLQEQMDVKNSRTDWGFGKMASGFRDLRKAQEAQMRADDTGLSEQERAKAQASALTLHADGMDKISKGALEVVEALKKVGPAMEQFGGAIGEIGGALSGLAADLDAVALAFDEKATKGDRIVAGLTSALNLAGMITSQIAKNKQIQKEWNRTVIECAHQYTMLRLNEMEYEQSNIFGVEDPYKRLIDNGKLYAASMKELAGLQEQLAKGSVQVGTKKAASGKNIGKGAGYGAGVGAVAGSFFGPIGTAIGTAAGAVIGGLIGLFGGRKRVPVFESLLSRYGWLYDDKTYELNPQILADYKKLDDTTKQIVDHWNEIKDKAKEAEKNMKESLSDLAGSIGSDLSDALADAFTNGDVSNAIDQFHGKITDVIQDIIKQKVAAIIFQPLLDDLQKKMEDSFKPGGDQDIVDDIISFYRKVPGSVDEWNELMKQLQDVLHDEGIDIFNEDSRSAQQKGIATASQDSVDENNARLTAIQGHTYSLAEDSRKIYTMTNMMLSKVSQIESHTVQLARLENMEAKLVKMSSTLSDIQARGLMIKA